MIDVMSLRQWYERREQTEIKWIYGHNNPADLMTKSKLFSALKTLIDTNRINLDITEWIERAEQKKEMIGNWAVDRGITTFQRGFSVGIKFIRS